MWYRKEGKSSSGGGNESFNDEYGEGGILSCSWNNGTIN